MNSSLFQKWYYKRLDLSKTNHENNEGISTLTIINNIINLSKKIQDWELTHLKNSSDPEYNKVVDDTYHQSNSVIPDSYNNMIHDNKEYISDIDKDTVGISPKLVHKSGDDYFMTKPYHTAPRTLPIAGWAIMATNKLYHAGKIPHLVEDVNTGKVNDISVTIHNFAKNFVPAMEIGPRTKVKGESQTQAVDSSGSAPKLSSSKSLSVVDPLQARQIGLMDFLTGNGDRHSLNVLVSDKINENGKKNLLAIDHDRSFTYGSATPYGHYAQSALSYQLGDDAAISVVPHKEDEQLSKWWNDNKNDVYEEMGRNLKAIKDDSLRRYIRSGFDRRFEIIGNWAKDYDNTKKSLFNEESRFDPGVHLHTADEDELERVRQSLPEDAENSLNAIADKISQTTDLSEQAAINNLAYHIVAKSNPNDFVKFLAQHHSDWHIKELKSDILMEMKSNPEKYKEHLKKAMEVNFSLPRESRFLNPFWESYILDLFEKK